MPPRAVLLDLYDTLVDGDWQGWRTQLSTLTGIDEDTLGMAYHLTREERNTGAYPTVGGQRPGAAQSRRHRGADRGPRARRRRGGGSLRRRDPALRRFAADGRRAAGTRGSRPRSSATARTRPGPIVEQLGLPALFDAVILSFEVGVRKPEPGIYLRGA